MIDGGICSQLIAQICLYTAQLGKKRRKLIDNFYVRFKIILLSLNCRAFRIFCLTRQGAAQINQSVSGERNQINLIP